MNYRLLPVLLVTFLVASLSCAGEKDGHDASGVFEARETIIAAEIAGQIVAMPIEEGQVLAAQSIAAEIDCKQLELQRAQITASDVAITERTAEAKPELQVLREQEKATAAQVAVQQEQLKVLERERGRFAKLVAAQAAPTKQLEDIEGQIAVLRRQVTATKTQMAVTRQKRESYTAQVAQINRATSSARGPTQAQVAQIDDQIRKCKVRNPMDGTVLTKYAEKYEFATPGKPLYKIADLKTLVLRAYITADQLGNIKLNQAVRVFIDAGPDDYRELEGTLIWISDKAEFTPKTIQTKDERSNLVYSIKIRVANDDGSLKIGMYAEVSF
jgi:HlyD family secretion protein